MTSYAAKLYSVWELKSSLISNWNWHKARSDKDHFAFSKAIQKTTANMFMSILLNLCYERIHKFNFLSTFWNILITSYLNILDLTELKKTLFCICIFISPILIQIYWKITQLLATNFYRWTKGTEVICRAAICQFFFFLLLMIC